MDDREFYLPPEQFVTGEELPPPPEFSAGAVELFPPAEEHPSLRRDEFDQPIAAPAPEAASGSLRRLLKKTVFAPVAATVTAVALVFSSYGYDPLGEDFLVSDHRAEHQPPQEAAGHRPDRPNEEIVLPPEEDFIPGPMIPPDLFPYNEEPDDAFPRLSNLEPNGAVPYYGVLNEEFVVLQRQGEDRYLAVGSARRVNGVRVTTVPGASYDADTNTLTLTDFSGYALNVNLMGNGFTVRLVGKNYLDRVLVWGFNYGGSITFTGSGSLVVNEGQMYDIGIQLMAEYSESCIMVDRDVTLEVYGADPASGGSAILVSDSLLSKSIYYLAPLRLWGGVRQDTGDGSGVWSGEIMDPETGLPSAHVLFAP